MKISSRTDSREPVDWVNPLIDTANRRFFFFSSACRPFGMVNLSPDTVNSGGAWGAGYRYDSPYICFFSHIHGWQKAGIPVLPVAGEMKGHKGSDAYCSRFSHEKETVHPGYHKVYLDDYDIDAELTSSCRVGFHRYRFRRAGESHIIFDLSAAIGPTEMSDVHMERTGPMEFTGTVVNAPTIRRPKPLPIHFVVQLNRHVAFGGWDGEGNLFEEQPVKEQGSGAFFTLDAEEGEEVLMKVSISYTSAEGALNNLETELDHWDFDRTVRESRHEWNDWLGRIRVTGGTNKRTIKFYTDLYHSLLGRRKVADVDGKYFDATGQVPQIRQVPVDADGCPVYEHHNFDALWGSQWTLNILWPLVYPEVTHHFVHSMMDMYRYGGLIPRGPSGGNYTFVMTSPTSTPFIVSAWQKGIRTFDLKEAYEGMKKNHGPNGLMAKAGYEHNTAIGGGAEYYLEKGFVHNEIEADAFNADKGGTKTLEYAYMDWCLAQAAKELDLKSDYEALMERSRNYKNIWNSDSGFFQPKMKDGSWMPGFDPWKSDGWVEANGWQSLWFVPHDVPGLIDLMGGRDVFVERLNELFDKAETSDFIAPHGEHHTTYMDYGNQPSTGMVHLFNLAGRPDLAQKWIRRIVDACKSDITPYGGYGGDEDQGQMGSLNVLMMLGLFQESGGCEADPEYQLSTPFFPRIEIDLDYSYHEGKTLTIISDQDPEDHPYIDSASFKGKPLDLLSVSHKELAGGGVLEYKLKS